MAKKISVNYTDTAISGATPMTLSLPTLNYAVDYRVRGDEPNEAIITNLTSPIDAPERIRWAHNDIKDVYKNTGIDPTLYYASRRGTQILCQLTDVLTVTDDSSPDYLAELPVSAHLVIKVPNNDLITEDVVMTLIKRMLAGLYETTGTTTTSRLRSLLRGSLLPPAL